MRPAVELRAYTPADELTVLALWQQSWQQAYPQLDFAARLAWFTQHWRTELVPRAEIIIAEIDTELAGFITVDRAGYIDQLVVAPQRWGQGVAAALLGEAQRRSPKRLELHVNQDNDRAIGFYRKAGFAVVGHGLNARSGAPVYAMRWQPSSLPEPP